MEGQQHLLKALLGSVFLIIFNSCSHKQGERNSIYITIYGKIHDRMTVKFDRDIIYDKRIKTNHLLEVTRGPFIINKDKVIIYYNIDNKDTSVTFSLKKSNYVTIGYSEIRHEFQFAISDSTQFFNSRID